MGLPAVAVLASFVGALMGGALLAIDGVCSLPPLLVMVGVALVLVGAGGFGLGVWRQSRHSGVGAVRCAVEVLGRSVRLVLSLLLS